MGQQVACVDATPLLAEEMASGGIDLRRRRYVSAQQAFGTGIGVTV
jgi:hypothetical protein